MKDDHEGWVKHHFNFDEQQQKDDAQAAEIVDEWSKRMDLENWRNWTYDLMSSSEPSMDKNFYNRLISTKEWLFTRVWPSRHSVLREAFINFMHVLQDLLLTFARHSKKDYGDMLTTEKFHKIEEWNPQLYEEILRRYEYHVDLIDDLTLELTRATNFVCDQVRTSLDPSYRIREGALFAESGMHMDFTNHLHRAEYKTAERTSMPYPGLEKFKYSRVTRNEHFGQD